MAATTASGVGAPPAGAEGDTPAVPTNEAGWPLTADAYVPVVEIGQGAFAKVLRSSCPAKGCDVAIKIISLGSVNSSMQDIMGEVRGMKLARHENVMELHCSFMVGTDLWLVMPLMDKGSCYFVMRALRTKGVTKNGEGLAEHFISIIMREVLQGLVYLHSNEQIHRDIKAGNILLNADGAVKLGDFGVAGWLNDFSVTRGVEGKATTFVGTPCWMAPEVMEQTKGYNTGVDIWSLGITALELAKGVAPYSHLSPMQVLIKTLRDDAPSLATYTVEPGQAAVSMSSQFASFVARCLVKDPSKRPSAEDLLKDKFIKKAGKVADLTQLLDQVPSVGAEAASLTGDTPSGGAGVAPAGSELEAQPEFVPGTTWQWPEDTTTSKVTQAEVTAAVSLLQGLGVGGEGGDDDEDEDDD